jgi:uncharacterized protein YjgD (DUF1641 family)
MNANGNGTKGWLDTQQGQQLQHTLESEHTLSGLNHLLARIDTLEKAVDRLATLLEQGPGMVSMVADMADESVQKAAAQGVDVQERLENALQLAERLTHPQTLAGLEKVLVLADQLPGMASMFADMADEAYRKAAARGIHLEDRLQASFQLLEKLTDPETIENLTPLLDMAERMPGILAMFVDMADLAYAEFHKQGFDPRSLKVVQKAAQALSRAQAKEPAQLGPFGLLRALRDPEMKKTLGFVASFGKEFGKEIN